ncbi:hypothetical protein H0W26_01630 [Candidatus Dependentiae bacterium]|nr:hypothetical protein [Candidatus Dependentiae bacterium]
MISRRCSLLLYGCIVTAPLYAQKDAPVENLLNLHRTIAEPSKESIQEETFHQRTLKEDGQQDLVVKKVSREGKKRFSRTGDLVHPKKNKKLFEDRALSLVKGLYFTSIGGASAWVFLKIAEEVVSEWSMSNSERVADLCTEAEKKHPFYQDMLKKASQQDRLEKPLKISMQLGFCGIIVYAHTRMNIFGTAYRHMKDAFS